MKYSLNIVWQPRVSWSICVLLIVGVFGAVSLHGQVSTNISASSAAQKPQTQGPSPEAIQTEFPVCPPPDARNAPQSQQIRGNHKVVLSWDASLPSNPESKNVRYCVYRRKKQESDTIDLKNALEKNPTCRECELVSPAALLGTRCLDHIVEDGAMYYYVVTAINDKGKMSLSSNAAPATIPVGNQSSSAPLDSPPPPLCRGGEP